MDNRSTLPEQPSFDDWLAEKLPAAFAEWDASHEPLPAHLADSMAWLHRCMPELADQTRTDAPSPNPQDDEIPGHRSIPDAFANIASPIPQLGEFAPVPSNPSHDSDSTDSEPDNSSSYARSFARWALTLLSLAFMAVSFYQLGIYVGKRQKPNKDPRQDDYAKASGPGVNSPYLPPFSSDLYWLAQGQDPVRVKSSIPIGDQEPLRYRLELSVRTSRKNCFLFSVDRERIELLTVLETKDFVKGKGEFSGKFSNIVGTEYLVAILADEEDVVPRLPTFLNPSDLSRFQFETDKSFLARTFQKAIEMNKWKGDFNEVEVLHTILHVAKSTPP